MLYVCDLNQSTSKAVVESDSDPVGHYVDDRSIFFQGKSKVCIVTASRPFDPDVDDNPYGAVPMGDLAPVNDGSRPVPQPPNPDDV